jgi:DNA-binding NarL/FixJ family response regulator
VTLLRILLVDDFEPFRRFVRSVLQSRQEFIVVGEAVDGAEAVDEANRLQPDLILMDMGLPKRNGISAAQEIAACAPDAKLLFISLDPSPDAARAVLNVGAQGYIHKLRVEADLIPAIEAVISNRQYISSDIDFRNTPEAEVHPRHEVQFYSTDEVFLESAIRSIRGALEANSAAVAIVTASHAKCLVQRLEASGFDVERAIQEGKYISLDVVDFVQRSSLMTYRTSRGSRGSSGMS